MHEDSRADLIAEVQRLILAKERKTGKPIKRATLARSIGVSTSSIYAYLNGTTLPPTDTFDRLLDALVVPAAERRRLSTARDNLEAQGIASPEAGRRPQELPPDVFGFTGRADELAELDQLLAESGEQSTPVMISAVSGTAGVGKTALAIHWAHRVRDRFPDGHLYVNLRGYDPDRPLQPAEVLEAFLRSLGVPGPNIPAELADRAARYRTLVHGKRMLIVLDNAYAADEVRELFPGAPSCFVVVTSRNGSPGLVARHDARVINLDLLPLGDAIALLRTLIGDRADTEPEAAAELAERCARLPLALRIAAELAVSRPTMTLTDLTAELDQYRLGSFSAGGDQRTAIGAVFSWSYKQLCADKARAFRLLGLHPGQDIDIFAVAALVNTDLDTAEGLLDALLRGHLVHQAGPGRFAMHDLLRAYAAEQADADAEAVKHAALTNLFDHYACAASQAMDVAYPHEQNRRPPITVPSAVTHEFADQRAAMAWLDGELPNLLTSAEHAADRGWPSHTSHLSQTLARHLRNRGRYASAHALHTLALRAARVARNRRSECHALINLGITCRALGRHDEALDHLMRALGIARDTDDLVGQGYALGGIGDIHQHAGRAADARDHYQLALDVARRIGDPSGEGEALCGLGITRRIEGDHNHALDHLQQSLGIFRTIGDRYGERHPLICLAVVHGVLGRYEEALDYHRAALTIMRDVGDRYGERYTLTSIGEIYSLIGRPGEGLKHLRQALGIARDTGDRQGEGCTLSAIGIVHGELGQHSQALDCHKQALAIFRDIAVGSWELEAHHNLGDTLLAAGRPAEALHHHRDSAIIAAELANHHDHARALNAIAQDHYELGDEDLARAHWGEALAIFAELGAPEADEVRRRLARLGPGGSR
ncbi:tetratricopeptide repeat protein [Lentzea sp. NPDC005914]|uniref:tetratricopeptide repeat protein n=1 Tax=Lentzea sp. NPDC005914 TaxID=3154572 RepID=UPI0033F6CE31